MGQFCFDANGAPIDSMQFFENDVGWRELGLRNKIAPLHFACCGEPIYLSRSRANVPFFSHLPGSVCVSSGQADPKSRDAISRETVEHWTLKHLVAHLAGELGWTAAVESSLPARPGLPALRANCLASRGGRSVAFEVLVSKQSQVETAQRAEMFRQHGVLCVWLTTDSGNVFLDPKVPFFFLSPLRDASLRSAMDRCRRAVGDVKSDASTPEATGVADRPDYAALAGAIEAQPPVAAYGGHCAYGAMRPLRDVLQMAFNAPDDLGAEATRYAKRQEVARFARQSAAAAVASAPATRTGFSNRSARSLESDWSSDALEAPARPVAPTDKERCASEMRSAAEGMCAGRPHAHPAPWQSVCADGDYIVQIFTSDAEAGSCVTGISMHRLAPASQRFSTSSGSSTGTLALEAKFSTADGVGLADLLRWFDVFPWMTGVQRYPMRCETGQGERFAFGLLFKIRREAPQDLPSRAPSRERMQYRDAFVAAECLPEHSPS